MTGSRRLNAITGRKVSIEFIRMPTTRETTRLIMWTLLLLLVTEAVWLSAFRSGFPIPQPYPKRNPWFRANWERFILQVPPKPASVFRVLVISNSQGFGRATPEAQIYPAVLERMLNEDAPAGTRCEIINWSVPGGQVPEYLFLLLHSGEARPDFVICSCSLSNFTLSAVDYTLDTVGSDIPLGLFRWEHFGRFSAEFRRRYLTLNFMLHSVLYRHTGSLPLASWVTDSLKQARDVRRLLDPHMQNQWLFGQGRVDAQSRRRRRGEVLRKMVRRTDRIETFLMEEFFCTIEGTGLPVLVIDQPMAIGDRPKARSNYDQVAGIFRAAAEKHPAVDFREMVFDIPTDEFLDIVHFTPAGHQRFARLLVPVVRQHLRTSAGRP
jgi:hypothetical protein